LDLQTVANLTFLGSTVNELTILIVVL